MHFCDGQVALFNESLTSMVNGAINQIGIVESEFLMNCADFKKIDVMFKHHVGIIAEDFQHKMDIVVEGHQMLAEKIDRLEVRMDRLETKVDGVAIDLAAHRADTEAHHGVYRVKESGD